MSTDVSRKPQLTWERTRRNALRRRVKSTEPSLSDPVWNDMPSLFALVMLAGLIAYVCFR